MIITTFGSVNKAYLEDAVNEDWEDIVDLLLQHNKEMETFLYSIFHQ